MGQEEGTARTCQLSLQDFTLSTEGSGKGGEERCRGKKPAVLGMERGEVSEEGVGKRDEGVGKRGPAVL